MKMRTRVALVVGVVAACVWVWSRPDDEPRRRVEAYAGGELLCVDGAAGYRTPAGMIVALNERGRRLAGIRGGVWSDTADLIDAGEVARMTERAERLC